MPMRDADEWAKDLCSEVAHEFVVGPWYDAEGLNRERIASLIREAQEDGARAERERTEEAERALAEALEAVRRRDEAAIDTDEAREIIEKYMQPVPPPRDVALADIVRIICEGRLNALLAMAGAEAERDAAIARAEKAEREANGFNELLVETLDKLTEAECDRDEAVKALDAHKERADRAESELHRGKW